jgi:nitrite transporter NirC
LYIEVVNKIGDNAATSVAALRQSPVGHFVRSMLAGLYVRSSVVLIFTVGAYLPAESRRLVMGVCFGGALTTVIFADSELFTGGNMTVMFSVWTRKIDIRELLATWSWTFGVVLSLAGASRAERVAPEHFRGYGVVDME